MIAVCVSMGANLDPKLATFSRVSKNDPGVDFARVVLVQVLYLQS